MKRTLAILALALAAATAARAATLAPEAFLPTDGRHAAEPAVAFGDGVYLVVWRADRNENADILACRVDASGKALDAEPFAVSKAKDCQEQPRVAFGGGNFLVVWTDLRSGKDYDVYAARVSGEGKVLDADGIAICAEPENQVRPAVAFDGKRFLVVWADFRDAEEKAGNDGMINKFGVRQTYALYASYVSAGGRAENSKGVPVQTAFSHDQWPALAVGEGGRALVAGETCCSFFAGRTADKKAVRKYKWRGGSKTPALASSGSEYLMAFGDFRPIGRGGGWGSSRGKTVIVIGKDGTTGEPLPTSTRKIRQGQHGRSIPIFRPAACWDGSAYVVAWSVTVAGSAGPRGPGWYYDSAFVSRFDKTGKLLDDALDISGSKESPARLVAAASDGKGSTLVAYEKHPKTADVPIKIGFRMLRAK